MSTPQSSLKTILTESLVEYLPIQDRGIILELLLEKFKQCKEIQGVKLEVFSEEDGTFLDGAAIKGWFQNHTAVSALADIVSHHEDSQTAISYVMPIFCIKEIYAVCIVDIYQHDMDSIVCLSELSYYLSVIFDRLDYIQQLATSNHHLKAINTGLDELNTTLNDKLKTEIESAQQALILAEEISLTVMQETLNKEIAHEIYNPLSILQLDAELYKQELNPLAIDWDLIAYYEKKYGLKEGDVKQRLGQLELLTEANDPEQIKLDQLGVLDQFRGCPSLHHYLISVFQSHVFAGFLEDNTRNVKTVVSVMEVLMKYGAVDSYDKSIIRVEELLQDICKMVKGILKRHGIAFEYNNKLPGCMIRTERMRLYQIFINLIKNSIDSMEDSVEKKLSIIIEKPKDKKQSVQITISDTGKGFGTLNLAQAIKKTSKKGVHLGVGLNIVHQIMKENDGTIAIENQARGAKVILGFPIYRSS